MKTKKQFYRRKERERKLAGLWRGMAWVDEPWPRMQRKVSFLSLCCLFHCYQLPSPLLYSHETQLPKSTRKQKQNRKKTKLPSLIMPWTMHYHEGEVHGEPDDDEEWPLLVLDSLPEVPKDVASLRETEQASAGSFFIGVKGGVVGLEGLRRDV